MKLGPRALARRIGGVVVMLLAVGPAIVASAPAAEAAPSAATVARYEARVIARMNYMRHHYGRGGLSAGSCPDRYAEWYAPVLAHKVLVHRQRWTMSLHQNMYTILRGCRAAVAAENLAAGPNSADQIVAAWMRSPGHRANILDRRLNRVGVAAVYRSGVWFVVADFTRQ
jgi:uncharacterized protein YkwD